MILTSSKNDFSSENDILSGKSSSAKNDKKFKKQVRGDHFKTRFRKTFEQLIDEEEHRLRSLQKSADNPVQTYKT